MTNNPRPHMRITRIATILAAALLLTAAILMGKNPAPTET